MKKPELISLLTQACVTPLGIKVSTNDPNRLRQRLYAMRRGNPEFAHLSFLVPAASPEDTLYILVKSETPNGES